MIFSITSHRSWYTANMQPGQNEPENWQQPPESPQQAPYEVPAPEVEQDVPEVRAQSDEPQGNRSSSTRADTTPEQPEDMSPDFDNDAAEDDSFANADDQALLRWEGTEYLHHDRGALWYGIFGLIAIALMVAAIIVVHSLTFALLIPVMAVALIVYVRRPPTVLQYTLSHKGLHVNDRLYTYDEFKAFGIVSHEGAHSVVLIPRKRFQIGQTVYFPEEVGEPLVDMLAARLPMKELQLDAVDRFLARIRL